MKTLLMGLCALFLCACNEYETPSPEPDNREQFFGNYTAETFNKTEYGFDGGECAKYTGTGNINWLEFEEINVYLSIGMTDQYGYGYHTFGYVLKDGTLNRAFTWAGNEELFALYGRVTQSLKYTDHFGCEGTIKLTIIEESEE
jgi:hypothetical protein